MATSFIQQLFGSCLLSFPCQLGLADWRREEASRLKFLPSRCSWSDNPNFKKMQNEIIQRNISNQNLRHRYSGLGEVSPQSCGWKLTRVLDKTDRHLSVIWVGWDDREHDLNGMGQDAWERTVGEKLLRTLQSIRKRFSRSFGPSKVGEGEGTVFPAYYLFQS